MSKTVRVFTDEPGVREISLRFSVRVVAPVIVVPAGLIVVTGIEGRAIERVVMLRRGDGAPLTIRRLENPLDEVLVATTGRVGVAGDASPPALPGHARPGDTWLRLAVAGESGTFDREGAVVLETDHPERPRIEIAVRVRTLPVIEVSPPVARVSTAPEPGSAVVVRLGHNGGRPFRILAVDSSSPELVTARAVGLERASVIQHVRVEAVATAGGAHQGTITVRTDDPGQPEVVFGVEVVPAAG